MKFLAIVIALLIVYWADISIFTKKYDVFSGYLKVASQLKLTTGVFRLALVLIIFMLLTAVIYGVLLNLVFGFLGFLFAIVVLLYCLGSLHFSADEAYPQLADNALEQIFSIIFWFVILGPVGAVLYRLNWQVKQEQQDNEVLVAADSLQNILDWIPIRLLAFCFALVGHFSAVIGFWSTQVLTGLQDNKNLLLGCFEKSFEAEQQTVLDKRLLPSEYLIQLVYRSLIVWLVVLALVVLF